MTFSIDVVVIVIVQHGGRKKLHCNMSNCISWLHQFKFIILYL